jgi:hypothetical protein
MYAYRLDRYLLSYGVSEVERRMTMVKKPRILGLVAGTLLVSVAVVNAGQEPALESTLVRRAAVLAARTNFGGALSPVLSTAGVQVLGFA